MANEIESISYIKIGASNHPIDAVTFQGNEVSSFVSKSVNDLTNYYNKTEIEGLMGALINFHYEIYASRASVSEPEDNVLYLIGPSGQGDDKYEEYVYPDETTGWVKIGDTTLDLSGYVTGVTFNGSEATVSNGTISISESDPVFASSVAYSITSADITNWNSKTSNTGTLTGVTFNGTSASVSNGIASISVSIPSAVTESTVSGWGFTKNTGTLTGITVNGSSATVTNGVAEISVATNGMPSVTSADNGKILQVMSGTWTLTNPISIYTGSESPNNSTGINGDIYLQS